MMIIKLRNLTEANKRYYHDQHRFIITSAGRRSRKTLIGKRKTLIRALKKQGRYFSAAPTMGQAIAIFWDDLKRSTKHLTNRVSETYHRVELINGSIIQVVGLDKPERIEGQPWHGCHITETPNLKPKAWSSNIRPVLSDTNGWAILDGVSEGRNWFYDLVLHATGGFIPVTYPQAGAYAEQGEWSYHNWFSADVLTAEEIEAVKDELDERTYRQEYEGSFEGNQGLAYYNYSEDNVDNSIQYDEHSIVHIGMDFNVNPMTATLNHIDKDVIQQFGEVYLLNSNTYEMAAHLKEMFNIRRCIIYPDSTGDARESNATKTDLQILRSEGFDVRAKSVNPRVKNRVNSFNSRLKTMTGKIKYKINAKNCPKTIRDLTRVESTDDGRINKEQEKQGLVHITDAQGYLISYLFPLIKTGIRAI